MQVIEYLLEVLREEAIRLDRGWITRHAARIAQAEKELRRHYELGLLERGEKEGQGEQEKASQASCDLGGLEGRERRTGSDSIGRLHETEGEMIHGDIY